MEHYDQINDKKDNINPDNKTTIEVLNINQIDYRNEKEVTQEIQSIDDFLIIEPSKQDNNKIIAIDFSKEFFPQATPSNDLQELNYNIPQLFVNNKLHNEEEDRITTSVSKVENHEDRIIRLKEKINLEDYEILKGKFYTITISQNGSRFMQRIYSNSSSEIFQLIFQELLPHLNSLMIESYANYFCPKLYTILHQENKLKFLQEISNGIGITSKSKIGTYAIQTVFDHIKAKEEQEIIVNAIDDKILDLCKNEMGVHVIEKIVICFNEDLIQKVYDVIIENFTMLAQNQYGLFVCKKVITCGKKISTLTRIQGKIRDNSMVLIKNQYGNYTIKIAIEIWPSELSQPIIESFTGNFFILSMEKYSSNVIELCLEKSDDRQLLNFIEEISKNNCIVSLIKNSFGNYVMQKAIKLTTGKIRTKFIGIIKKNLEKINDNKLVMKWKGIINSLTHLYLGNNIGGNDLLNISGSSNGSSCNSIKSSGSSNKKKKKKKNPVNFNNAKSTEELPFIGSPMHMSINGFHSPIRSPIMNMNTHSPNNKLLHSPIITNHFIQYPTFPFPVPLQQQPQYPNQFIIPNNIPNSPNNNQWNPNYNNMNMNNTASSEKQDNNYNYFY